MRARIFNNSAFVPVADAPIVNIFPNPSKGEITIRSPYAIDRITVMNQEGKTVYAAELNTQEHLFRLENAGLYFVNLLTGGYTISKKIVVVR